MKRLRSSCLAALSFVTVACGSSHGPEAGSQTHFLRSCDSSCPAPYSCLCGVCSLSCQQSARCTDHAPSAVCVPPSTGASCSATPRMCDVECRADRECANLAGGFVCELGRCRDAVMSMNAPDDVGSADADTSSADAASDASVGDASSSDADLLDSGPTDVICDGSEGLRLVLSVGGGFTAETVIFTSPYGHSFMAIDGKCHYFASASYRSGTTQGQLSVSEMEALQRDVGWARRKGFQGESASGCADGSSTSVVAQDARFSCECGLCADNEADKTQAIRAAAMRIQSFAESGTSLTGAVSALAVHQLDATFTGPMRSWPLTRPLASINGLVIEVGTRVPEQGVRFDDATESSALRKLRNDELSSNSSAGFVYVTQANAYYFVYVRDELPTAALDSALKTLLRGAP